MIYMEIVDEKGKGGPPIKSQGSEWTDLLSKLLLREEARCSWTQS